MIVIHIGQKLADALFLTGLENINLSDNIIVNNVKNVNNVM